MSPLARYIVDAIVLEGQSPTDLARKHPISRSWIYQLLARFKEGGYPALESRSRRPHSCPHQAGAEVQAEVLKLRHDLVARVAELPSAATVLRILKRNGLITPQPHKRPRSSFVRFKAQPPNETWQ